MIAPRYTQKMRGLIPRKWNHPVEIPVRTPGGKQVTVAICYSDNPDFSSADLPVPLDGSPPTLFVVDRFQDIDIALLVYEGNIVWGDGKSLPQSVFARTEVLVAIAPQQMQFST